MATQVIQDLLFDDRFLDRHAGQLVRDPIIAIVELVANSWDAHASNVEIEWPEHDTDHFSIRDDGEGMSGPEFAKRWRTLNYNRIEAQGEVSQPPSNAIDPRPRKVFGRNGKGRHAALLFSDPYEVRATKGGVRSVFRVSRGATSPLTIELLSESNVDPSLHGLEIFGVRPRQQTIRPETLRKQLSTRFLINPNFNVSVNGIRVTFDDASDDIVKTVELPIPGLGVANVMLLKSTTADKTTRQHGIAWHVNGRLVGECRWRNSDRERILDGRSAEAKRYTFLFSQTSWSTQLKRIGRISSKTTMVGKSHVTCFSWR